MLSSTRQHLRFVEPPDCRSRSPPRGSAAAGDASLVADQLATRDRAIEACMWFDAACDELVADLVLAMDVRGKKQIITGLRLHVNKLYDLGSYKAKQLGVFQFFIFWQIGRAYLRTLKNVC